MRYFRFNSTITVCGVRPSEEVADLLCLDQRWSCTISIRRRSRHYMSAIEEWCSQWHTCIACVVLGWSFTRADAQVPAACTEWFDRYCLNGSLNSTTPSSNFIPTFLGQEVLISSGSSPMLLNLAAMFIPATIAVALLVLNNTLTLSFVACDCARACAWSLGLALREHLYKLISPQREVGAFLWRATYCKLSPTSTNQPSNQPRNLKQNYALGGSVGEVGGVGSCRCWCFLADRVLLSLPGVFFSPIDCCRRGFLGIG